MTRSSDLVMVERDVLEAACERLQMFLDTFGDVGDCVTQADINDWLSALQSVEGGVQPSIATKQATDPEGGSRTETAFRDALQECQRVLAMMIDPASIKSTSVLHAFAAATEAEAKARTVLNGATKSDGGVVADTPSNETATEVMAHPSPMGSRSCDEKTIACGVAGVAPGPSEHYRVPTNCVCCHGPLDHNRQCPICDFAPGPSDSAPNHQPHALSQGWRTDLENAPSMTNGRYVHCDVWVVNSDFGGRREANAYRNSVGEWCDSGGNRLNWEDVEAGVLTRRSRVTHWTPPPAPPSPAKTGGNRG